MKIFRALLWALVVLIVAIPARVQADPKENIRTGDKVAARWTDGNYYIGAVEGLDGEKFQIAFEDGDKLAVSAAKVFVLHNDAEFRVGDHVMAVWQGARMFPGVLTAVNAESCVVKWDDGDTPMEVKKGRMMHWENR